MSGVRPAQSMPVLTHPAAMQAWSDDRRAARRRVVVVPTMGALHEGHLALIEEARRHGDDVVVTIFVNPLQFNSTTDFDVYPRPIDDDIAACRAAHVHAVYAPTAATMYPYGFQTHVSPGPLADRLEGRHRPGHFSGVTTVVTKLFAATRPHVAVFGQKDAQQLAIVRQMAADLDLGVQIVGMPTVREPDGLAMSSRNRRLSPTERRAAACIWRGLDALRAAVAAGERDVATLTAVGVAPIAAEPLARLEYLEIVDPVELEPIAQLEHDPAEVRLLAVTAVWFGDVRLIDNITVP
jgi:pantoate--beta-alanine ligase